MEESGSVPVWPMTLVAHVDKDGIIVIGTPDGVLVLRDAFVETSTCFTDVLAGTRGARDGVWAHLPFVGRGGVY